ncbi:hypothetical protein L7F22_029938 [Adiantum nelumboides]|nr:hypothetical protein [Adiantum nelumboides]
MERSTGPRIYVPISMPDHASQPTYAVLEFVGFSTPAPPSHPHLVHSPTSISSTAPTMLCLPPAPSSSPSTTTASPPSSFFPLHGIPPLPPHHTLISAPPLLPISNYPDANTLYLPSPPHLLPPPSHYHYQHQHHYVHGRPYPSARLEVVNLDSPPSSPSSLAPSSASSASRESSKEKHSHSSAPPITTHAASSMGNVSAGKPMLCYNSSPSDASSTLANGSSPRPIVNFSSSGEGGLSLPKPKFRSSSEGDIMQTQISVSQTDRETIVHTHLSNFRDVVRQLTGASSDDQDLLPVTLPARLANRVNNANMMHNANGLGEMSASGAGASGSGASIAPTGNGGACKEQLGLRRAPLKLHERRKSTMKNLEKITNAYSFHGAKEVSPIMNPSPVTPLASDFERFCNASTPTSQGSSGVSSPIGVLAKGKSTLEAAGRAGSEHNQQQESGCFFSLQRPRLPASPLEKPALPTLLSLFPESPACSPRDYR